MKNCLYDSLPSDHWARALPYGACRAAFEWARTQPTAQAAWDSCERGDWMLWLMCFWGKKIPREVIEAEDRLHQTSYDLYDTLASERNELYETPHSTLSPAEFKERKEALEAEYNAAVGRLRSELAETVREFVPEAPTREGRTPTQLPKPT